MIENIINFWFSKTSKAKWFNSTTKFDQEITDKYEQLWEQANKNKFDNWAKYPMGSLALVIILDQFPLNMFRNQAKSFSSEQKAISIALNAVENKQDKKIPKDKLSFLYMPFMHSEDIKYQDLSVKLYDNAKFTANLKFAKHHRNIIKTYGRFPHRNAILSRQNTKEENAYLSSKNAFLG